MNDNLMFMPLAQSQSVELLHKPPVSELGPNFCVLLGGKKRWRENDAQVSLTYSCRHKQILNVLQVAWYFRGEGYQ